VSGQTVRDEDEVLMLIPARTLHTLLFFSDRGKVYSEKVYQLPDAGRTDKGIPIVNILALDSGERITAAVAVPNFSQAEYLVMSTVRGRVKRSALSEYSSVRPSGVIAITLEEGDELGWVRMTNGKEEILFVTARGQALRYSETAIRPVGRQAAGVTGINLKAGDRVAAMEVVEPQGYLLVITEQGFGKRTPLVDYPVKGRGTGGVAAADSKSMDRTGPVALARVVQEDDEVAVMSANGVVLRLKANSISISSRAARGVHLINLGKGDTVVSLARFRAEDVKRAADENSA